MNISKISEVLTKFKQFCRLHGWKTSENEDWIDLNEDYHNFLTTKNVSPTSFKTIIRNRKCVVRKGMNYSVVEPSYLAWLFSETPPKDLLSTILENPEFSRRIAIFDLSPTQEGKNRCIKLNNTDSPVFHEFETFLQTELKIKTESFQPFSDPKVSLSDTAVPQLA